MRLGSPRPSWAGAGAVEVPGPDIRTFPFLQAILFGNCLYELPQIFASKE
ncbi:hypothetical protein LEP1GSC050_4272 [Leptospira broomii serovar Hurstbridge str. 5399]|uniref:Uncharacterized protein n=1 Tax=Leptospira broomii serovar Hurstbridge str. 5399 TaxID=1049789 RepID=T0FDR8_9LEPT|nr:hypothetical protein LEP1GSC050_4272 [Leptospira broomii serovar Hurstbridge str. 5399]